MIRAFLFLLLIAGACRCAGGTGEGWQPYHFTINRSNGLPSDEVYDIFEDKRGYIWLATGIGLYRYDGHDFVAWQSNVQTSTPGSCIQQDGMGRIWYENFDGFLYYTNGAALSPLQQEHPTGFAPYSITGRFLFVVQTGGIDVYDIQTLTRVRTIKIPYKRMEHSASAAFGIVLIADGKLYSVDTSMQLNSCLIGSQREETHQAYCHGDSIYVLTRAVGKNQIEIYNRHLQLAGNLPVRSEGMLRAMFRAGDEMWLCSSSGCRPQNGRTAEWIFPGKSISRVIKDLTGNHWFATTNEGIFIVPALETKINKLNGQKITQVATTGYGVLAGTQNGDLLLLPPGGNSAKVLHHDKQSSEIYYLYADADNIFYSATGFTILNTSGTVMNTGVLAVKSVYPSGPNYYAIAASGSCRLIARNRLNSARNHDYPSAPSDSILISNIRARAIVWDSTSGKISCATNKGIVTIATTSGKQTIAYQQNPVYASAMVLSDGYVYAADTKGKLLRFKPGEPVQLLDGLPGSGDVRLLRASNGHVYYTTRNRLYELLPGCRSLQLRCHIEADAINDVAVDDSLIWIATNKGLVSCKRNDIESRTGGNQPAFYINAVRVNARDYSNKNMSELAPDENNVAISYSILEFASPAPAVASYRLNNGVWIELPANSRTLQFRSLAPGSYNVQFRINNAIADSTVTFRIGTPFWQQPWFYVMILLAAIVAGQVAYNRRVRKRIKKLKEQQEKAQLEEQLSRSMLTALRSQMNPHFFFNALNTIQAYIFTNEKTKAGNYLSKFSMLTRTILEMSETETVLLADEVEATTLYLELEKMRFGNDFEYTIDDTGINNVTATEIPSMILQPFIENAVKHGLMHKEGPKKLLIRLEEKDKAIRITIDDNGIGRSRSEALNKIKKNRYKSYSTRATAERVRLLNTQQSEKIKVEIADKINDNGTSGGTTVTITIAT